MFYGSEHIILTFTNSLNLCCDLDLERSNPTFPEDIRAYDAVLSNQVWSQMDQQFRRYSENSQIFYHISPHCDLDIEDSEPIFPHDASPRDNTPPHQVWFFKNGCTVQQILSGHDQTHGENIRTNIH